MTFAEALRRVRTRRKLTQLALATRAGITRTTLSRFEGGLKPGPLARQRLVAALGFATLGELYAAAGEPKATTAVAEARPASNDGGRMRWGAA